MLGKAVICIQTFTPVHSHKNVPWAQKFSLQKDKEPLQTVMGILLCLEKTSTIPDFICTSLFWLSVVWYLVNPTAIFVPSEERIEPFVYKVRWMCAGYLPTSWLGSKNCWLWGTNTCIEADFALPPLCVSKALFHPISVWVMSFLMISILGNHEIGWQAGTTAPDNRRCYVTCYPPCGGTPSLEVVTVSLNTYFTFCCFITIWKIRCFYKMHLQSVGSSYVIAF